MEFSIFTAVKNLCILHGQVFVMCALVIGNPLNTAVATDQHLLFCHMVQLLIWELGDLVVEH